MQEDIYKQAILKWKNLHPDKKYLDIPQKEIIELEGIGPVNIGNKINILRVIYKAQQEGKTCGNCRPLSEEDIAWYNEQHMIWDYEEYQTEVYKQAILKWKSLHPDKKYLDIPRREIIELEGIGPVNIGTKIVNLRTVYKAQQEGKTCGNCRPLSEEDTAWYNEQHMIWDYVEYQTEVYKQAILKWKSLHPDKKYLDILQREIIELEGVGTVNIGTKVSSLRKIYRAQQEGKTYSNHRPLSEEDIAWYNEQHMIWDYEEYQKGIYKQAILKWKSLHPDEKYLDIPQKEIIELEGIGLVNIGRKIKNLREIYRAQQKEESFGKSKPLTDEAIAWYNEQHMIWDYNEYQQQKLKREANRKSTLEKYTELFNGNQEKAERVVQILQNLRAKRKCVKKDRYNIENLLQEFNVKEEELLKQLNKTRDKTSEKENMPVLRKEGASLRKFCIENGYNYEVISRAVRLHSMLPNEDLESTINRVIIDYNYHGQNKPSTWIYEKYGNLVKHVLTNLHLNSQAILKNMTENVVSLEEAIKHDAFLRCKEESSNSWLEEPYNYLADELKSTEDNSQIQARLIEKAQVLIEDYHLTREEYNVIFHAFEKYTKAIREYQMYDVGLETNFQKKQEKIKAYQMSDEDIEESFFVPLQFENGVLLGRQSELYKRRNLLRQYVIDWNEYNRAEKESISKQNEFTPAEVKYIETTREEIDSLVALKKK